MRVSGELQPGIAGNPDAPVLAYRVVVNGTAVSEQKLTAAQLLAAPSRISVPRAADEGRRDVGAGDSLQRLGGPRRGAGEVEQRSCADVNCDGLVNNGDIDAFVLALTDSAAYAAAYPGCNVLNADCSGDGLVNNGGIDAFVALLTGG